MALGYSWTFYHVYRSYRTMHDMTTEFGFSSLMEFEIGFYVYVLSCVLLVVCLLIKNTKKEDRVLRTGPTVQQGMNMPCLIGFYRSGMLGNASLINHSCSITLDQAGTLQVMIANLQVYRHEIQNTQIQERRLQTTLTITWQLRMFTTPYYQQKRSFNEYIIRYKTNPQLISQYDY